MSRFLFSTLGSLGDLHPYIAIARELISLGHEAVIATAEDYRPAIEGTGVEFAPVRPGMAELGDYKMLVEKTFDAVHGPEFLIRRVVMPHLRAAYACLLKASQGADLLVAHPLAMALPLVAQKQGLPWAATVLSPISFMSSYDFPVFPAAPWLQKLQVFGPGPCRLFFRLIQHVARRWERPLENLRYELGLPPSQSPHMFKGQFSPLLNLALFDQQLAQPQQDWPEKTVVCGTPIFDGTQPDSDILTNLERFLADGEAPLVFALGSSAVWIAGDFWKKAITATVELGRRAILLTGPDRPAHLSDTVRAYSYLPYSKVFPHAAVIVHQAGIGTLAQAMRSGRPQLITPLAFDQPDNAVRAQALGFARSIPFRQVTTKKLTIELSRLLDSASSLHAAHSMAASLAKINGARRAASVLSACAQERTRS